MNTSAIRAIGARSWLVQPSGLMRMGVISMRIRSKTYLKAGGTMRECMRIPVQL